MHASLLVGPIIIGCAIGSFTGTVTVGLIRWRRERKAAVEPEVPEDACSVCGVSDADLLAGKPHKIIWPAGA